MRERLQAELRLIEAEYGDIEIGPNAEWFIIKRWALPAGWNKTETAVLVLVPSGYPVTPPDNFYVDDDLRVAGTNQPPGNASPGQVQAGKPWLQFSHHVEAGDWQPHPNILEGHNLLTFLIGVRQRLVEVN